MGRVLGGYEEQDCHQGRYRLRIDHHNPIMYLAEISVLAFEIGLRTENGGNIATLMLYVV